MTKHHPKKQGMFHQERQTHFSLRKYHSGLASVAVATSLMFLGAASAAADTEATGVAAEETTTGVVETTRPGTEEPAGTHQPAPATEPLGLAAEPATEAPVTETEELTEVNSLGDEVVSAEPLKEELDKAKVVLEEGNLPEASRSLLREAYNRAQGFYDKGELTKSELSYALSSLRSALETVSTETRTARVANTGTDSDIHKVSALISPETHVTTVTGATRADSRVILTVGSQVAETRSGADGHYRLELTGVRQLQPVIAETYDDRGEIIGTASTTTRYYAATRRPANQGQPIPSGTALRSFPNYVGGGGVIYVDESELVDLPTDVFFSKDGRHEFDFNGSRRSDSGFQTNPGDTLAYTNIYDETVTFVNIEASGSRHFNGLSSTGFEHYHNETGAYTTYKITVGNRETFLLTFGNMDPGDGIRVKKSDLIFGINTHSSGAEIRDLGDSFSIFGGDIWAVALKQGAEVTYAYDGRGGTLINSPQSAKPNLKPGRMLTATINWADGNPSNQALTVNLNRDGSSYTGTGGGSKSAPSGTTTLEWGMLPKYQGDDRANPPHDYTVRLASVPSGYEAHYDDTTNTITLVREVVLTTPVPVRDKENLTATEKEAVKQAFIDQNPNRTLTPDMIDVDDNGDARVTADGYTKPFTQAQTVIERAPHPAPPINAIDSDDTTISGTGDDGATVTVYIPAVNGQADYTLTAVVAGGAWTVSLNAPLPSGTRVEAEQDSELRKTSQRSNQTVAATQAEANRNNLNPIVPTPVYDIEHLTPTEKEVVKAEVLAKNPTLAARLTGGADGISVADNGDVTLTYLDNSVDNMTYLQPQTVRRKTDRERADEGRLPIAQTPVKDKENLSADEQAIVKAAIETAYPNRPADTSITVNPDGTATVTFQDGSTPIDLTQDELVIERPPHDAPPINPIDSDDTTISGTGADGATVTVYVPEINGQPAYTLTAEVSGGTWSVPLNAPLPTGTQVEAEQESILQKLSPKAQQAVGATQAEANFRQPALTFVDDINAVTPAEHDLAIQAIKDANGNFVTFPATVVINANDTATVTFTGDGSVATVAKEELFIQKLKGTPTPARVQEKAVVPDNTLIMTPNKPDTGLSIPNLPAGVEGLSIDPAGHLTGTPTYTNWGETEETTVVTVTVALTHAEDPAPVLVDVPVTIVRDTDNDGIPDLTDTDDDNDGIPDGQDDKPKEIDALSGETSPQTLIAGQPVPGAPIVVTASKPNDISFEVIAWPANIEGLAVDSRTGLLSGKPVIDNWGPTEETREVIVPIKIKHTGVMAEEFPVDLVLTILRDTDEDGTPDTVDTDDDNDGIPDDEDATQKIETPLEGSPTRQIVQEKQAITDELTLVTANKKNVTFEIVEITKDGNLQRGISGLKITKHEDFGSILSLGEVPTVRDWTDEEDYRDVIVKVKLTHSADTSPVFVPVDVRILRDTDADGTPDGLDNDDDNDGIPDDQDPHQKAFDALTGDGHPAIVLAGKEIPANQLIATINKPINNLTMTFTLANVPATVTGLSVDQTGNLIGTPTVSDWATREESRDITVHVVVNHVDPDKAINEHVAIPVKVTILRDTDGDGFPDMDNPPAGFTPDLDDDNDDIPDVSDRHGKVFDQLAGQPKAMTVIEGQPFPINLAAVSNKVATTFTITGQPVALTGVSIVNQGDFESTFTGSPRLSDWASDEEVRTVEVEVTLTRRLTTGELETAVVKVPVTIKRDTDGDGDPDITDSDDDNDNIPDIEDITSKIYDALTAEGRAIVLIDLEQAKIAPALATANKHQTKFFLSDLFPYYVSGLSLTVDGMIVGTPKVSNWKDGETERTFNMRVTANNGSERVTVIATITIKRALESQEEKPKTPEQPKVEETTLDDGQVRPAETLTAILPEATTAEAPVLESNVETEAKAEPTVAKTQLPKTGDNTSGLLSGVATVMAALGLMGLRKRRED